MILKIFFFPFPIPNHDVIKHIKNITKEFFLMFKRALKIITIFWDLKKSIT
jgi:hypothetical protein